MGFQWFISKKTIIFQGFRGGPTFSRGGGGGGGWSCIFQGGGGSNFFQGEGWGLNANLYRNQYSLWFSRGVRTPYPPSGSAHVEVLEMSLNFTQTWLYEPCDPLNHHSFSMQPFVFFLFSVYSMELPAQKFVRAVQKNCQLLLPCGGNCTGKTHTWTWSSFRTCRQGEV